MRILRAAALILALAMTSTACGGGDDLSIEKPWARSSPNRANAGAVYMELESDEGDRLIGASVDAAVAATVEIHETAPADMGDDSGDDMAEGMAPMTMREVGEISLPAGETVFLEPGGYHVMLLGLAEGLQVGETFELTLQFENAGDQTVEVEVREEAP